MNATELFLAAVDLPDGDRARFLDERCGGDVRLRAEVERLIAHDGPTDLLRGQVLPEPALPDRIGPYEIVALIGSGGMGHVYDARQTHPLTRRVALKVVRPALSTERVLARFEFERRTLARLDHPNITRILDAGETDEGAPYFVMEHVDGVGLREYCEAAAPSIERRLALFESVCAGVAHAHQKGIIHRDLKPTNVLVAEIDGKPVPKIIDFGIARAVEAEGATRADERPGTPGYMSPEQQTPGELPVDTRADVYALGVLLYELLVDARPAAPTSDDPAWRDLPRRFGDLVWIVARAVRRDPDRRYPGAAALAEDLSRYRDRRPIAAHPGRYGYRVRRFARRNWVGVSVSAAALIALLAFTAATAIQSRRVSRERDLTRESEQRARRVLAYLVDMFSDVKPELARGVPPTAEQMLDRGARSLDTLDHDPIAKAWLQATLGGVYRDLGSNARAEELLVRAVETQRVALPRDAPERSHALNDLGSLYTNIGRFDEARPLLGEALELRREAHGDTHRAVAQTLNELGRLAWETGDLDNAEGHYAEAAAVHERLAGPDSYDVAVTLINLSNVVNRRGDLERGGEMLRRAMAILESTGLDNDPHLADCLNNLGIVSRRLGDSEAAIRLLERATRIRRDVLGDDHPDLAMSLTNLGSAHWSHGDLEQARRYFEHGLEIRERVLPADHPHIAFSVNALAVVHKNLENYARSRALFERGLGIGRAKLGDGHPDVARLLGNLGNLEREVGNADLAREHYDEALAIYLQAFGEEHPDVARIEHAIGALELGLGRPAEAHAHLSRALQIRRSTLGEEHASTVETRDLLSEITVGAR